MYKSATIKQDIDKISEEINRNMELYKLALEFWTIEQLAERIYCDRNTLFEWDIKEINAKSVIELI
jgi:hypothetical protein